MVSSERPEANKEMMKIKENSELIAKKVNLLKKIEEIDKEIAKNVQKRKFELAEKRRK